METKNQDPVFVITHKDLFQTINADHYELIIDKGHTPEAINGLIKMSKADTNLISDGYHTFGELYEHRIQIFITLCKVLAWSNYKEDTKFPENPTWRFKTDDEWFLLGIGRKEGEQITYHLPISKWDECLFANDLDEKPEWDGHISADVLERLKKL